MEEQTEYEAGESFEGFEYPRENWTKLPNILIERLPDISSLSEMKIILYILRHTWGYQEFDDRKRISLDDFQYGREKKEGRIDNGIGMTRPSIISGVRRAIKHGFITEEVDDTDKGRITKRYSLKMKMLPEFKYGF